MGGENTAIIVTTYQVLKIIVYLYTGGCAHHAMRSRSRRMTMDPRISTYSVGTEHVGFSPNRQTLPVPSAKRREVLGESHEG